MKRTHPTPRASYRDYQEDLRADFWFSCGYCTITEAEAAGIRFEIDHYLPQKHFSALAATFGNLVYSCAPCNGIKSDFYPGDGSFPMGLFLYRPDRSPEPTYGLAGYKLTPGSRLDEFNIDLLSLNRAPLVKLRELRERLGQAREYLAMGIRGLKKMRLDQLPTDVRGRLPKVQKLTQELEQVSEEILREFASGFARSPLLDSDPDRKKLAKERREALAKHKAVIAVPSSLPSPRPVGE